MRLIAEEDLKHATPAERAAYEAYLVRALALTSPLDYAEHVSRRTERYRHILLLNRVITRLIEGRLRHPVTGRVVRKLAVSMPPRHGKSYLISDHTPAWAITKYAAYGFRVGLAAYESDFAADWGRKARAHINDTAEEFGIRVDNTTRASDRWDLMPLEPGGPKAGMNTAGVGGPFTGRGFHLLIIDDPIKNAEWAMSEKIRQNQYDWLGSTALTRLEPTIEVPNEEPEPGEGETLEVGHAVILVNTRWHEDDLMGRVLKDEPDEWYHLNLKALADTSAPESDPLRRNPGEALCRERYDEAALYTIRDNPSTGGYWWAAMYQGEPMIEGGGLFKRDKFCYWRPAANDPVNLIQLRSPTGADEFIPRKDVTRFSTLDLAATIKKASDWSVLSTFDVLPDRRALLVDRVRQRVESADHEQFVLDEYHRLKPAYIGIEKATYGLSVITKLRRLGVPIRPLDAKGDKFSRAIPAGNLVDGRRFFWPEGVGWLEEWEGELLVFPNGAHDDQVDTLSYAAHELTVGALSVPLRAAKEPEEQSLEAKLERYFKRRFDKRKTGRHPDLGKV